MIPSDPEDDSPWDKSDSSSSSEDQDDGEVGDDSDDESSSSEAAESKEPNGENENDESDKGEAPNKSDDEDDTGLIDEIRKRKLVEEPAPEVDTCSAVDVQFAPETLDVAIAFKRKIKTYFISVNNTLEEGNCYKFPKPYKTLTALTYDSTGSKIFALSGKELIVLNVADEDAEPTSYPLFSSKAVKIACGEDFLAVGDDKGNIYVVNSESFELQFYVNVGDEGDQTESVAIENSTVYATVGFRAVKIDVATKKIVSEEEHSCDLVAGITQKMSFVTGSTNGELVMFRLSDLTPQGSYKIAKKTSISALAVVDSTRIAVALDNGQIKLFGLFPNVEIGIVGSVETSATSMTSSCDGEWLLVNDHFQNCKLFSLTGIDDPPVKKKRKARRDKHLPSSSCENKDAFFSLM